LDGAGNLARDASFWGGRRRRRRSRRRRSRSRRRSRMKVYSKLTQ
jgi:hypothetical protein